MSKPSSTLFLAVIVSNLFVWSENYELFTAKAFLLSFVGALAVAFLLLFLGRQIERLLAAKRSSQKIITPLFASLTVLLFIYFLDFTFSAAIPDKAIRFSLIAICWIALTFLLTRFTFLPMNVFLVIWGAVALASGCHIAFQTHRSRSFDLPPPAHHNVQVSLKRKPNVYLFILESYSDLNRMEKIYAIDTAGFRSFLENHNFLIYENVYGSGTATLESMTKMFTFGWAPSGINGVLDGDKNNFVFRIFKENGYKVGVHYSDYPTVFYYMKKQGIYCNFSNIGSWVHLLDPFFTTFDRKRIIRDFVIKDDPFPDVITGIIKRELSGKTPLFFVFKGGAGHSPIEGYNYEDAENWVKSGTYKNMVNRSNDEIVKIVQNIAENDPQSMVILIGDHGPYRYRNALQDIPRGNREVIRQQLKERGITFEDLADDVLNIFLAVRFPEGKKDISYGRPINHSNLFLHVFSGLNDSPGLFRVDLINESYLDGVRIIREGKVVP